MKSPIIYSPISLDRYEGLLIARQQHGFIFLPWQIVSFCGLVDYTGWLLQGNRVSCPLFRVVQIRKYCKQRIILMRDKGNMHIDQ